MSKSLLEKKCKESAMKKERGSWTKWRERSWVVGSKKNEGGDYRICDESFQPNMYKGEDLGYLVWRYLQWIG